MPVATKAILRARFNRIVLDNERIRQKAEHAIGRKITETEHRNAIELFKQFLEQENKKETKRKPNDA